MGISKKQHAGFSMVEACIVIVVMFTILGFTLLNINSILPGMRANKAMNQTIAQLRSGRELAVAQRRNIEVKFLGDNQIQLERIEIPNGSTVLSTVTLEHGTEFCLIDGVPDTPDAFGNNAAVDFGGASELYFLSDGTLVDSQGDPVNGTVFLGEEDHPEYARAVTVLGATGRIRCYWWNGTEWTE